MRQVNRRRLSGQSNGPWLVGLGLVLCLGLVLPTEEDVSQSRAEASRDLVDADHARQSSTLQPSSIPSSPDHAGTKEARHATAAAVEPKPSAWSTVVTVDPAATATGKIRSSKPGDWQARTELARDLQKALTRAGCYGGEISGSWTQSTRRAMGAFIAKVNASLPVSEPDYILLTLMQSHPNAVCGGSCSRNEVAQDDGRCVPHAIMAQAEKTRARISAAAPVITPPVVAAPVEPARVAALQPPAARHGVLNAPSVSDEKLPWLADDRSVSVTAQPARVGQRPTVGTRSRPDGMMSVGAPPASIVPPIRIDNSVQIDVAAIDAAVATAATNTNARRDPTQRQRIAVMGDDPLPSLGFAPIDGAPAVAITGTLTRSMDQAARAKATTIERGRNDQVRRSYRKTPRRDTARRPYRRQYSGYASAQPFGTSRRYYKRRFMAPFNMIQRLDGIY